MAPTSFSARRSFSENSGVESLSASSSACLMSEGLQMSSSMSLCTDELLRLMASGEHIHIY